MSAAIGLHSAGNEVVVLDERRASIAGSSGMPRRLPERAQRRQLEPLVRYDL